MADNDFTSPWTVWMKFVAQMGALGVCLLLLAVLVYRQQANYDKMMDQREEDLAAAHKQLNEFRAWAESREDKRLEREDKSRDLQWKLMSAFKDGLAEVSRDVKQILARYLGRLAFDAQGLPMSPVDPIVPVTGGEKP